jgi:hypothetical protein
LKTLIVFLLAAASAFAQAAVPLGTATNFAILAGSAVTNTGSSVISGAVGVSPLTSITGFPPATIVSGTGTTHSADAAAGNAQNDLTTAYNNAAGQPCGTSLTGMDLGSVGVLGPGVYCFSTSAQLTGTLTLNGGPNAIFIFQIGSTLTTASSSVVQVTGGAQAANIFWQVGSSVANLGTGSTFIGNILALTSITSNASVMAGRMLARNGAVTIAVALSLTAPPFIPAGGLGGPPATSGVPVPSSWLLILIGLACATLYQTRERWLGRIKNT